MLGPDSLLNGEVHYGEAPLYVAQHSGGHHSPRGGCTRWPLLLQLPLAVLLLLVSLPLLPLVLLVSLPLLPLVLLWKHCHRL